MLLYYLRHGEKKEAKVSYFKKLTEFGKFQARAIGKLLSKIYFDIVYVSPYLRTRETFLNLPLNYAKLEIRSELSETKNPANAKKFLEELRKLPDEFVCLVVGHGNFEKLLLAEMLNVDADAFVFHNASLSKYWIGDEVKIIYLNFTCDLCKGNL